MLLAPEPPPVSFARDVAPILAFHCNGCHGDAGGLSTRTYASLMLGGNKGKVVIAGKAEDSLLVHFIDGRRGESRRMPLGGKQLTSSQIETIRRWIEEGAREDSASLPRYVMATPPTAIPQGRTLVITCRIPAEAYVTLRVRNPETRRVLFENIGAVKAEPQEGDLGSTRNNLTWRIHSGEGWPSAVLVELQQEYTSGDPGDPGLSTRLE